MIDKEFNANLELVKIMCKERNFPYEIEIHYSDNMDCDKFKYLHTEKYINAYKEFNLSELNGIALPFENHGYHILINAKKYQIATTLIHEVTHIIDYYEFMIQYNHSKFDIENHTLYKAYYFYSEFNARLTAHNFYLNHLLGKDIDKDIEIPELNKRISKLHAKSVGVENESDFYELMQLLGRWYAIENVTQNNYELANYIDLYDKLIEFKYYKDEHSLIELNKQFKTINRFW